MAKIAYFLANIFIVPDFIFTFGVDAYELITLATSVTRNMAIVVQSLNAAITRFFTVNLQREGYADTNKMIFGAIYNMFCQESVMRGFRYHTNDFRVTTPDTEYNSAPIVVVRRVVQISPSGAA